MNNAQVDEIPDVEGAAVGGDDDEEEAEEERTMRVMMRKSNGLTARFAKTYDSFSDVGENRVYFASKILTPCRMH